MLRVGISEVTKDILSLEKKKMLCQKKKKKSSSNFHQKSSEEKPHQLVQQNSGCPAHGDDECIKLLTQPIVNYCPGIIVVELRRKPGTSLGLGIAGGADKKCPPIISCLKAGNIAHRSDSLHVGDRLIAVNGYQIGTLSHEEILSFIRKLDDPLELTVEYNLNELCFQKAPKPTIIKCLEVQLEHENFGVGLTLRGGVCQYDNQKTRPLTIFSIRPGGPTDREGRLRVGDRVISINGMDVRQATHNEAMNLLKTNDNSIGLRLAVEYDVNVFECLANADGTVTLEIDKNSSADFGVVLKIVENDNERRLIIDDIIAGSVADRCGALHVGDEILSIDRITLEYTTLAEVYQLLKSAGTTNGRVIIEILPIKTAYNNEMKNIVLSSNSTSRGTMNVSRSQIFINPYHGFEKVANESFGEYAEIVKLERKATNKTSSAPLTNGSLSASFSTANLVSNQICHREVMEVVLNCYNRGGYGLLLHGFQNGDERNRPIMFISYIERGSPAEKSGVLQIGDRIMAINEFCLDNISSEDVNQFIRHATGPLTLTVEFDVIETLLPSTGMFTVKLAKRGQNLGIVIRSSGTSKKGDLVVVSDVRTGSVAHRCGSIQPGDQLLSIDNIPLDTCTVEESVRLLQSSSDVVKLRIKKPISVCEEFDKEPNPVVYSIELSRKNGPLGITIAGVDDRAEPVFISQVTKGGLAERTGAIHIGDRILAINGYSLDGKRVSEAIQLLQDVGDTVNFKILRNCDEPVHYSVSLSTQIVHERDHYSDKETTDKLGTPVQSIDSAVESLDDSPNESQQPSTSSNRNSQNSNSKASSVSNVIPSDTVQYIDDLNVQLRKTLSSLNQCPSTSSAKTTGSVRSSCGKKVTIKHSPEENYVQLGGENCPCQSHLIDHQTQDEWMRVLEALETVGEVEMLRRLEESILTGNVPLVSDDSKMAKSFVDHSFQTSSSSVCAIQPAVQAPLSIKTNLKSGNNFHIPSSSSYQTTISLPQSSNGGLLCSCSNGILPSEVESHPTVSPQSSLQVIRFILFKDPKYNDFGFSISEGFNGEGVYINKIRMNGPADKAEIKSCDKILMVNDIDVQESNCVSSLKLITDCGNKLVLLLCRDISVVHKHNGSRFEEFQR